MAATRYCSAGPFLAGHSTPHSCWWSTASDTCRQYRHCRKKINSFIASHVSMVLYISSRAKRESRLRTQRRIIARFGCQTDVLRTWTRSVNRASVTARRLLTWPFVQSRWLEPALKTNFIVCRIKQVRYSSKNGSWVYFSIICLRKPKRRQPLVL